MDAPAAHIGDTAILNDLPRPFDPAAGRTWVGPSHSFVNSQKRTRPELVVGADGTNINLYSIQSSNLLQTQATRPQSRLTAPPCAVTHKRTPTKAGATFLYAAIEHEQHSGETRIECFRQAISRRGQLSPPSEQLQSTHVTLPSKHDQVIALEPVLNSATASDSQDHDLLVTQEGGKITSYSQDLRDCRWSTQLAFHDPMEDAPIPQDKICIHAVSIGQVTAHTKTFLKHHEHMLGQLGTESSQLSRLLLVGAVFTSKASTETPEKTARVSIAAILPPDLTPTRRPKTIELATWTLPAPSPQQNPDHLSGVYRFDMKHGLLIHTTPRQVIVYDLLPSQPNILFNHTATKENLLDCTALNRSVSLITTQQQSLFVDMNYQSVLARRMHNTAASDDSSRKRKRSASSADTQPSGFTHYFEKLGAVADIHGSYLARHDVSLHRIEGTNKRRKTARLADAIGCGLSDPHQRTTKRNQRLDQLRDIFQWSSRQDRSRQAFTSCIKIKSSTHHHFPHLASQGLITPTCVQQALADDANHLQSESPVTARDLLGALIDYDPTFALVAEIVSRSPSLGLSMVTECLRLLLHSFSAGQAEREGRLLKDVSHLTNGDLDDELQVEEDDAAKELELASELLEHGLDIRASVIKVCFEKLATCYHHAQVSRALKKCLSPQELFLMIDVLRLEMSRGGWASYAFDSAPESMLGGGESHAISAICDLLNCAVDAIGTGSLVPGEAIARKDEVEPFVATLRNETSAILEGVQEASFFDGFLEDFLHYESFLNNSMLSLYSEKERRREDRSQDYFQRLIQPAALPISTKSIERVSATSVGRGGEITKRTARDIGQQLSERVGLYSLDRIRF